ncbi:MAG: ATPase, T2SS/T4P/T4SS family [Planctomycetota bacterium]
MPLTTGVFLVSPWKPVVLALPFLGWAWLISAVYDKHAAKYFLERERWGLIHLAMGLIAFIVAIGMPLAGGVAFFASLGAVVVLLGISAGIYPLIVNRDERVPEDGRVSLDLSKLRGGEKEEKQEKHTSSLVITTPSDGNLPVPDKDAPEYEVRVEAEQLFIRAITARASQVDILPAPGSEGRMYVESRLIDGVRQNAEPISARRAAELVAVWKAGAGLDVKDMRRKQQGIAEVAFAGNEIKTQVTTSGSQSGLRATLLFNPDKAVRRPIEELGLRDAQLDVVRGFINDPGGVVIVASPADNGGTTTLYSLLKLHDPYMSNVQTIEFEPRSAMEGIRQNKYDPSADGVEYDKLVRSILRRDPDVVGVGELPDADTAKTIVAADLERSRVYVSERAEGAMPAIQLWGKAVGTPETAAAGLKGVIAQKLVRKLCENCRTPYQPTPDMLKKLNLPADRVKQLYKKGGQVLIKNKPEVCPVCQGSGYVGQTGIFEVVPIEENERALIKAGNLNAVRAELLKRKLPTMGQCAMMLVAEGVTSVEEVTRVTQPAKKAAPSGGAAKRPAAPARSGQ